MKHLKLYENFDFNEEDFDFEEEEGYDGFNVGDKVICIRNIGNKEGSIHFIDGVEYEITKIKNTNDDLLQIKPIWMVYKNYDKYKGDGRWEFKKYFIRKGIYT